ncbi:hypothetical protein C8J56DRAFT_888311 [Mycena floridula]|nr:hypothetical protein C8J56DRAFT_888311 [Mycena floridula]
MTQYYGQTTTLKSKSCRKTSKITGSPISGHDATGKSIIPKAMQTVESFEQLQARFCCTTQILKAPTSTSVIYKRFWVQQISVGFRDLKDTSKHFNVPCINEGNIQPNARETSAQVDSHENASKISNISEHDANVRGGLTRAHKGREEPRDKESIESETMNISTKYDPGNADKASKVQENSAGFRDLEHAITSFNV